MYILFAIHNLQVFQIAYCDFFSPSLCDEWQMHCHAFVDAVKENMPNLLDKPKTHLILHLVECMHDFGPSSAFCDERYCCVKSHVCYFRFESFNSRVGG